MKEAFVGFDSAWSAKNKGGISWAVFEKNSLVEVSLPPQLALAVSCAVIFITGDKSSPIGVRTVV